MAEPAGGVMRFGILGPLLVHDGQAAVDVPAARQRVLLAALTLRAGQAVAADELAEVLWDGQPSAGAAATLRTHVMRLRAALGPLAGARVVTRYPGYALDVTESEVDHLRFSALCGRGGTAARAGDWAAASRLLGEALELWRGAPLDDVPSDMLRRDHVAGLEQVHLEALEWQMEAGLAAGGHAEMVAGLQSLVESHGLRERFHAQLMVALFRCGRQAEALAAYQQARQVLVTELGAEPGAELQELHGRVLAADPGLLVPVAAAGAAPARPAGGVAVPHELPAPVRQFTGRDIELAALTAQFAQAGEDGLGTVVISAIAGTAGVGKTALAVQWAHQVAKEFPDGQLYVNLRGYDPGQPMPPGNALAGFLRALGVNGQDIPAETDQRAARFRSLLAGRRILIVADNAGDTEQVRPLLPGTFGSLVVVTSRDALSGLVARDGAVRIDLDLLPLAEAVGLLRELIGDRVDADHSAAAALAGQCARLPLALRIAAELAAARPAVPLAELASELASQAQRLDLLDVGGDPRAAIRSVFSWSCQRLDGAQARMFRLLGLHPGGDFDPYAAAALTDTTAPQAQRLLDSLSRAYLIQSTGAGRYGMHDLLSTYARELSAAHDSSDERHGALARLYGYYLCAAAGAMDVLFPADSYRRPRIAPAATPVPPVADTAAARSWLDAHRAALLAVAAQTATEGWPRQALDLATTLSRYLIVGCHYSDLVAMSGHARHAAHTTEDRDAEAEILNRASIVYLRQGRLDRCIADLRRALGLYRETGNKGGQARTLNSLGNIAWTRGRYTDATGYYRQANTIHRDIGNWVAEARSLINVSVIDYLQGRYSQATSQLEQALAVLREAGDLDAQAMAMLNLGRSWARRGDLPQATGYLQQALAVFRDRASPDGQAYALSNLGLVSLWLGDAERADGQLREGLALARQSGDRLAEAEALNALGEAALAAGDPSGARAQYRAAFSVAHALGERYDQAWAHRGLALACEAEGSPEQARRHWQHALRLYRGLGTPEAAEIAGRLAAAT